MSIGVAGQNQYGGPWSNAPQGGYNPEEQIFIPGTNIVGNMPWLEPQYPQYYEDHYGIGSPLHSYFSMLGGTQEPQYYQWLQNGVGQELQRVNNQLQAHFDAGGSFSPDLFAQLGIPYIDQIIGNAELPPIIDNPGDYNQNPYLLSPEEQMAYYAGLYALPQDHPLRNAPLRGRNRLRGYYQAPNAYYGGTAGPDSGFSLQSTNHPTPSNQLPPGPYFGI